MEKNKARLPFITLERGENIQQSIPTKNMESILLANSSENDQHSHAKSDTLETPSSPLSNALESIVLDTLDDVCFDIFQQSLDGSTCENFLLKSKINDHKVKKCQLPVQLFEQQNLGHSEKSHVVVNVNCLRTQLAYYKNTIDRVEKENQTLKREVNKLQEQFNIKTNKSTKIINESVEIEKCYRETIEPLHRELCQTQKILNDERQHIKDLQWNYHFLCIEQKRLKEESLSLWSQLNSKNNVHQKEELRMLDFINSNNNKIQALQQHLCKVEAALVCESEKTKDLQRKYYILSTGQEIIKQEHLVMKEEVNDLAAQICHLKHLLIEAKDEKSDMENKMENLRYGLIETIQSLWEHLWQTQKVLAITNEKIKDLQSKINLLYAVKDEAQRMLPYLYMVETERNELKGTIDKLKNEMIRMQIKLDSIINEKPLQEASSSRLLQPTFAVMHAMQGENKTSNSDNGEQASRLQSVPSLKHSFRKHHSKEEAFRALESTADDLREEAESLQGINNQPESQVLGLEEALKESEKEKELSLQKEKSLSSEKEELLKMKVDNERLTSELTKSKHSLLKKENESKRLSSQRYINITSMLVSAGTVAAAAFLCHKLMKS